MRRLNGFLCLLILTSSATIFADGETFVTTRSLSTDSANQVAVAAEQSCRKGGYKVSVAVVDRQGNLLAFVRNPLSGNHTIKVSQAKAYTAATLLGPTIDLVKEAEFLKDAPEILLLGGGVPVQVGGHIYGAVGVSGAPRDKIPGDVDDRCAREGIAAVKEALEFSE